MQKKEPKAKTSKKVRRKEQPQAEQKKQELQIVCSSSEIESETTSKEPTKPEIFEDPSKIAGDNMQGLEEVDVSVETETKTASPLPREPGMFEKPSDKAVDSEQVFEEAEIDRETKIAVATITEMLRLPSEVGDSPLNALTGLGTLIAQHQLLERK
ncbi:hypothetical protein TNCT_303561 [Trichonephila clavata]|uniref:Uncharacterized protein n=2 Tax=Trichonephila clavata TaxID=2740835 RepID=A0A8X6FEW7_TRICU|nr:hypothetical protein TNCT_303561 [Trichonephila clavata]